MTALDTHRPTVTTPARRGAEALIASGVVALTVTLGAMTFAPRLARHGSGGYIVSGVLMTAVDLLYLAGVLGLLRSAATRRGGLRRVAAVLALAGSAGVVIAEVLLRVSFHVGTAAFSVVGPAQALGVIGLGIAVIRTGSWSSWRRFVWLVQGAYVPLVLVPALAASGGQNLPALAGFHTLVLISGVAFAIEERRRDQDGTAGVHVTGAGVR